MYTPGATYRIQLHHQYTLQQLEEIIEYLHELGITTIYASPVTAAGKESLHGYDVTDPGTIDPEIGTEEQLKRIAALLKEKGMGWLQDIVPNHMSFTAANSRLMDVMERGSLSPYYRYFDIDWEHPASQGKLMVPFLGEPLEEAIQQENIRIILTNEGFKIQYHQQEYPLSLAAYQLLISMIIVLARGKSHPGALNKLLSEGAQGERMTTWHKHRTGLFIRLTENDKSRIQIEEWLAIINKEPKRLTQLLDKLYYRLCYWKEVDAVINYRRFFTVSSLICLRMESEDVFRDYHQLVNRLYYDGIIQGVRIDHIDGLHDPEEYIKRLRRMLGMESYIIAEKILEDHEALPASWQLQGTSGYEFLSFVSQLLTSREGGARLLQQYHALMGSEQSYARQVMQNKKNILQRYMQGEADNLVRLFHQLDLAPHAGYWKEAITAIMAAWPVYRLYLSEQPWSATDKEVVEETFAQAIEHEPSIRKELEYLHHLFRRQEDQSPVTQANVLRFIKRMMQYTGPAMAKGVEDTTFYTYNPLIAHNEVGDSPATLGHTIGQFHEQMRTRQAATPLSLNATATHDTKRGEDARTRLIVLSEIPEEWESAVKQWVSINEGLHNMVDNRPTPTLNEEYFIYQAIVGGFPEDGEVTAEWIERLQQYITKALREAKEHTSWDEPHQAYEQAAMDFIRNLFQDGHKFLSQLRPFISKVNARAAIHSLSQLLIKITAPGIPDIYQGCELWDLSYVDPDNRRPVDYQKRVQYLQQIKEQEQQGVEVLCAFLQEHRAQGMEKMYLCYKALHFRKEHTELFTQGEYIPMHVESNGHTALAYARQWKQQWILTIVPLSAQEGTAATGVVELPAEAPVVWTNVLTGEEVVTGGEVAMVEKVTAREEIAAGEGQRKLELAACWRQFPVAILYGNNI